MPEERTRGVATRFELYTTAATLCFLILQLILIVLIKFELEWFRFFVFFFVLGMMILYGVLAFLSKPQSAESSETHTTGERAENPRQP